MKYGVNKQILLITAGAVWITAGINILRIGIITWLNNSQDWMFKIGEATVVFSCYSSYSSLKDFIINTPGELTRKRKPVTALFLFLM